MGRKVRVMSKTPAQILRENRIKAKLTQEDLAALVGCKKANISKFESPGVNGREITIEWARKLAPHVGLKPYQLLPDLGYEEKITQVALDISELSDANQKELDKFYRYLLTQQPPTK